MKKPFYFEAWFLCLLFAFWFFVIPFVFGIILLICSMEYDKKEKESFRMRIDDLDRAIKYSGIKVSELKIEYNCSNPTKLYPVNKHEDVFFEKLTSTFNENKLHKPIYLTRMSNGAIAVSYSTYPIGKIKLQGRKQWMQILKNLYDAEAVYGTVEDFIPRIDEWVKYIKKYL